MTRTTAGPADVSQRLFAVVGATGQQGEAMARALLAAAAGVRALVRDPRAQPARALADRDAEVVRADIDDPDSLRAALTGVDGLFAMTTSPSCPPIRPTSTPPGAWRQGRRGVARHAGLILATCTDARRDQQTSPLPGFPPAHV